MYTAEPLKKDQQQEGFSHKNRAPPDYFPSWIRNIVNSATERVHSSREQNTRGCQRPFKKHAVPEAKPLYSSDSEEEQENTAAGYQEFLVNLKKNPQYGQVRWCRGEGTPIKLCPSSVKALLWGRLLKQRIENRNRRLKGIILSKDNSLSRVIMTLLTNLRVSYLALASRIIVLLMQFFSCNFMHMFKHNNDGFRFVPEDGYGTALDKLVNSTLGGFVNWDGQYFLHVAVYGYTEENMLAFFPLFPKIICYLSQCLHFFFASVISFSSLVLTVGCILNAALFIMSANILFDLIKITNKTLDPTPVILLFCFNPASIFFSSLYTESLFLFLTLKVLMSLYNSQGLQALFWAAMSALCRSNGILNLGFVAAFFLQNSVKQYFNNEISHHNLFVHLVGTGSICASGLIPFAMFQKFAVDKFCNENFKSEPEHILPPYCNYEVLPYSYVQEHYWNVGAFRYFEMKQIPNFLLAMPVLYCTFPTFTRMFLGQLTSSLWSSDFFNLYIAAHGVFLTVFCFIFIHVQVSTRLILSAFPYFYIYLVEECLEEVAKFRQRKLQWPAETSFVQVWSILYFIVGTLGFSLGYPWT